ncbi:MAG: hypothetical protein E7315_04770 [Clostridiales bacterium]|nr:hypothetical protein [Clostridiales bacterium]
MTKKRILSVVFIIIIALSVFCGCSGMITPSPKHSPNIMASPSPIIPIPDMSPDMTMMPTASPDVSPMISPMISPDITASPNS